VIETEWQSEDRVGMQPMVDAEALDRFVQVDEQLALYLA
jgi:hypothetical protein